MRKGHVQDFILPHVFLTIVAILVRRGRQCLGRLAQSTLQWFIKAKQLIFAQGIELTKGLERLDNSRIESKHKIGRSVLVIIRRRQLVGGIVCTIDCLQLFRVGTRWHGSFQSKFTVRMQTLGVTIVFQHSFILHLIVGHVDSLRPQIFGDNIVVRRIPIAIKVDNKIGIGQGSHRGGRVVEKC